MSLHVLSFKPFMACWCPATVLLPLDTTLRGSPETLHRTGFTGIGCVAMVLWSLICCWVDGIFLWLVSGSSGKTGQPSAGNFWSLGDRDLAGMSRSACHHITPQQPSLGWSIRMADVWTDKELDFFCADVYWKKNDLFQSFELGVHIHVVCFCVNTAVFVTCFFLLVLVTKIVFPAIIFNILQVGVSLKEQSTREIPWNLVCAAVLWSGHLCHPIFHQQRVCVKWIQCRL